MDYKTKCEEMWTYEKEMEADRIKVRMPDDVFKVFKNSAKLKQECFWVVTLDGAHKIIKKHKISMGLLNRTVVHPREVYYPAIKDRAQAIVIMHNHPSGSNDPSQEDIDVTKRMAEAGELMGIQVLDHIIFSRTGYYSFKEGEYKYLLK